MDPAFAVSICAVTVSVIALAISSVLTARQVRLAKRAVYVPPFLQLMAEFRNPVFHDHYNYVVCELRKHDPALGVFGLPEEARTAVIDIAYHLQNAVSFVTIGLLEEEQVMAVLHFRLFRVWEAIEPYVLVERERSTTVGRFWLSRLELYAERARAIPENKAAVQQAHLPVRTSRRKIEREPRSREAAEDKRESDERPQRPSS